MSTVLKAAAAYFIVLFAIRLIGRRTASQAAPLDMVVLLLLGAMMGSSNLGLMHVLTGWLKLRSLFVERVVDGTPIVVFEGGRLVEDQMRKLRMQEADIRTAMRQEGMIEMDDMRYAIVERDGSISIIPKEKK